MAGTRHKYRHYSSMHGCSMQTIFRMPLAANGGSYGSGHTVAPHYTHLFSGRDTLLRLISNCWALAGSSHYCSIFINPGSGFSRESCYKGCRMPQHAILLFTGWKQGMVCVCAYVVVSWPVAHVHTMMLQLYVWWQLNTTYNLI